MTGKWGCWEVGKLESPELSLLPYFPTSLLPYFLHQSCRNAVSGSSREARNAGTAHAMTATVRNAAASAVYVTGSVGDTPTSMPAIALDNRPALNAPMATPMALNSMPW